MFKGAKNEPTLFSELNKEIRSADRKEILEQSIDTFRAILKDQNFGDLWVGQYSGSKSNSLFASVQTLNSSENYKKFDKDYFDFIILDACVIIGLNLGKLEGIGA